MKSVTPNIFVNDINQTIAFYKKLGFKLTATVPDEKNVVWAMMTCGSIMFMFQTFESLGNDLPEISRNNGGSLLLYIEVGDVEKLFDELKSKVKILKGLETTFYGAKEFAIKDINSYILTFAQNQN